MAPAGHHLIISGPASATAAFLLDIKGYADVGSTLGIRFPRVQMSSKDYRKLLLVLKLLLQFRQEIPFALIAILCSSLILRLLGSTHA